jgi:acetolactate synthase-1/2/3 large subunit
MAEGHGGLAVAGALRALGVDHLFTLTGGHIFPILDGCHRLGINIVDTRHEQSAAFAAEGWARLTRSLGVVAVTAGPGVTNSMSALAQARANQAPMLALAGRAPAFRWGQGSLQEIDHTAFVDPIAEARTLGGANLSAEVVAAGLEADRAPRGPRFLDFPLDLMFGTFDTGVKLPDVPEQSPVEGAEEVVRLLGVSERPLIMAGSNVWADRAESALLRLVETSRIPVYMNGQGRGCVPADHEMAFARSRSRAFKEADLAIVVGAPIDFRLGFGQNFAAGCKVVHVDSAPELIARHVELAAQMSGPLERSLRSITQALERPPATRRWLAALHRVEEEKRAAAEAELHSQASPIHPLRIYGELVPLLDRGAIVIGDGGDFVSFAGREIPSYEPGCWLDPGPYGCLGVGPGYAIAARLAHSDRQVVVLFGDGALGFSGTELETLVRLRLPFVAIVGNNGVWGLEKHPMRALFGHDVAADLRPGLRYDKMMESFGGRGQFVTSPDEIAPALKRALSSGEPTLVNVVTDPEIAYPRSANLA